MTTDPRVLDLFCGAGGAAKGYAEAGFEVVGVDIKAQPHYPFEFHRRGALEVLEWFLTFRDEPGVSDWPFGGRFDLVHASPPCPGYSRLAAMHPERRWPLLIEPIRLLLAQTEIPFVIENVEGAPLLSQAGLFGGHGVQLCGTSFGLGARDMDLRRHRLFETSFPVAALECSHKRLTIGVYGHGGHSKKHRMAYASEAREALGIDWMNRDELSDALPPAYTKYLGEQFLNQRVGVGA